MYGSRETGQRNGLVHGHHLGCKRSYFPPGDGRHQLRAGAACSEILAQPHKYRHAKRCKRGLRVGKDRTRRPVRRPANRRNRRPLPVFRLAQEWLERPRRSDGTIAYGLRIGVFNQTSGSIPCQPAVSAPETSRTPAARAYHSVLQRRTSKKPQRKRPLAPVCPNERVRP